MDGISLRITVQDAVVMSALSQLATVDGDKTPLMESIGGRLEQTTRDRFDTGTAPDGTPWIATEWSSPQVQVKSGQLRDSTTHVVGPDFVEVGTNLPYARQRHWGGEIRAKSALALMWQHNGEWYTAKSVWQPARPIYGLSDWDREDITDLVGAFIAERTGVPAP